MHFNSHTDVVEVGHGWTTDPFGGRGAGRPHLRPRHLRHEGRAGRPRSSRPRRSSAVCPDFAGAIEISGTADEETGGYGGVAYLAEQGLFRPDRVQHVIIPEPLNKDRICLGHRGVWWAEIETKGEIAHGSMPFLGDCADPPHGRGAGRDRDVPVSRCWPRKHTAMPVVPEGARQSTLNINSIHGGEAEQDAGFHRLSRALRAPTAAGS